MDRVCAACGRSNDENARFCAGCGAALSARCPRCGTDVPPAARFCPACGQPLAEPASEERKVATALFVDLVDSTGLGERVDPERLRAVLQVYFSLVSTAVGAWGGTVEKYIGDAVLAVFGVPRTREDDPARALNAALEIVGRFEELAGDVAARHGVTLGIRLGVTTGEIVAPSEVRQDRPMVTGDAINVAARLQAAAEPGHVVVDDRTYPATRHLFRFADADEVSVKGRQRAVRIHRLLGRIAGSAETGPARNMQARVVGRERDLATLGSLLDEAVEARSPRLAMVYGVAGIGKSRLVVEALALAASERPDLTVLRGRCLAVGQGITYWPLAEIVRDACGIALDDGTEVAVRKLVRRTNDVVLAAGYSQQDADGVAFALATTAGIAMAENPLDRSRPGSVATELERRWPQFLSALAARQPTVVVIEDLHWASEQVVQMLERLLVRSTGPLLLIATARPDFAEQHPSFGADRTEAATVALRPLKRAHAAALLGNLLGADALPASLRDQILDTAEGNPLFIEEIVNRLIDSGTLETRDGAGAGGGGAITLPDTIGGLLGARIDGLPDDERRILREASVVGRVFWEAPVAAAIAAGSNPRGGAATTTDSDAVSEGLSRLERRGLVSMRPRSSIASEVEYEFKHALIRDVAYSGISLARRARAHAAVAGWLAAISGDRSEELAELVAFHYRAALGDGADIAWASAEDDLGEVRHRARDAFLAAGATARKRFAIEAALELHRLALELSNTNEERADAHEQIGDDYDADYDGDHAVPAWESAISVRRSVDEEDPAIGRLALKIVQMGAVRWGGFTVPMEPEALDGYVDFGLASHPDEETRAWLLVLRAATGLRWIGFHRPDPVPLVDRVEAGRAGLAHAETTDDVALAANARRTIASLLISYGDVTPGLELTRAGMADLPSVADPRQRHLLMIENAQTLIWIGGDHEPMLPTLRDALRLGRELRIHDLCHSTGVLINALYLCGRWGEIPSVLDEHLTAFQSDSAGTTCPFALGAFQVGAAVLAHRGELDRARELAARMPKSEAPVGMIEALQAVASLGLGDPATARELASRVTATGRRNYAEEPALELVALLDSLVALGDWDSLSAFLTEAHRRSSELAILPGAILRAEGLMAAAAGDSTVARQRLMEAVAAFDGVAPFEAARAREALAAVDAQHRAELLEQAVRGYEALDARPHADRVRALLGTAAPASA